MKKKIVSKKRNVKKKVKRVSRKRKITSPEQWGKEFEAIVRKDPRPPVTFNFIKGSMKDLPLHLSIWNKLYRDKKERENLFSQLKGHFTQKENLLSGDPFHTHTADALRYSNAGVMGTEQMVGNEEVVTSKAATRGELGAAPADKVDHPSHYNSHPSGVECIQIAQYYGFNIGNVIKYCWRAGLKDVAKDIEDLKKAAWYLNQEIKLREQSKS